MKLLIRRLTRMPVSLQASPEIVSKYHSLLAGRWRKLVKVISDEIASQPQMAEQAAIFQEYALNSGKMIRPSLMLFTFEACRPAKGASPSVAIIKLALSLELLHLSLLIQDDVMDECLKRRHYPSLHARLSDYHKESGFSGNSNLYGSSLAVLISDICINYAEGLWTKMINNQRIDPDLRGYFDRLKTTVYKGQTLDLCLSAQPQPPSLEEIFKVMKYKTALYSMYYPMLLGARLAKVQHSHLGWLKTYAVNLGIAYQAVDDILGTFGDTSHTGKPVDQDILQKKRTLLLFFAYQKGGQVERSLLKAYLTQTKVSKVLATRVKTTFIKSDVARSAQDLARMHGQRALKSLEKSYLRAADSQKLEDLVEFVLARTH